MIDFDEFLLMVEGILLEAKNHLTRGHDNIPSVEHTKYFMQSRLFQEVSDGLLDRPRDEALARTVAGALGLRPGGGRGEDQLLADPSAYVDAMDAVRAAVSRPTEALGEDLGAAAARVAQAHADLAGARRHGTNKTLTSSVTACGGVALVGHVGIVGGRVGSAGGGGGGEGGQEHVASVIRVFFCLPRV